MTRIPLQDEDIELHELKKWDSNYIESKYIGLGFPNYKGTFGELKKQILDDYEIVQKVRERIKELDWTSDKDVWEEKLRIELKNILKE